MGHVQRDTPAVAGGSGGGPYAHPPGRIPTTPLAWHPPWRGPRFCVSCGIAESHLLHLKVRRAHGHSKWCGLCDLMETLEFERQFWAYASRREQLTQDAILSAAEEMSTQIQRNMRGRRAIADLPVSAEERSAEVAAAFGARDAEAHANVIARNRRYPQSREEHDSAAHAADAARFCNGCGRVETFVQLLVMRSDTGERVWCSTCNKTRNLVSATATWKDGTQQERTVMESFLMAAVEHGTLIRANSRARADDPMVAIFLG